MYTNVSLFSVREFAYISTQHHVLMGIPRFYKLKKKHIKTVPHYIRNTDGDGVWENLQHRPLGELKWLISCLYFESGIGLDLELTEKTCNHQWQIWSGCDVRLPRSSLCVRACARVCVWLCAWGRQKEIWCMCVCVYKYLWERERWYLR